VGNDPLDAQTSARLLKRALGIVGDAETLAGMLGVPPPELRAWLSAKTFPPREVFERVLELILGGEASRPTATQDAKRPRVLIADSRECGAVLATVLGNEFALTHVTTLVDALDLVQWSAASTHGIDAIVCGQHFEGSQMLRFLECVKAYRPTSAIPFIGCRVAETHLGDGALAAMREACEALGALAYIDLPGRSASHGAERAAVEFRDAVRAAVHLRAPRERLRVLVVDDNPDAAHTLVALLRMAGHDAHKAGSGAEALALAAQLKPDAAVLDIGMQDMDGYALAGKLRTQPWGTGMTLVALTGHDRAEDRQHSREAGFDHHLGKPATLEQLLEAFSAGRKG
jgi:CheY-like chemotaxis protein/DNA-binding transcriptional regulator YdaS (Cro superfamily)